MYEVSRVFYTPHGNIHYWLGHRNDDLPWLAFLPGLSADPTLFDKQIDYFTGTFNCFIWDAPAHGRSRPFALKFTMEDLAEYLHDIFKKENIVRPTLVFLILHLLPGKEKENFNILCFFLSFGFELLEQSGYNGYQEHCIGSNTGEDKRDI